MFGDSSSIKDVEHAYALPSNPVSALLRSVMYRGEHLAWQRHIAEAKQSQKHAAAGESSGGNGPLTPIIAASASSLDDAQIAPNAIEVTASLVLLLHICALAAMDPTVSIASSFRNQVVVYVNFGLSAFYALEVFLSLVCLGIPGGGSVARPKFWLGLLDMAIVAIGVASAVIDLQLIDGSSSDAGRFFEARGLILLRSPKVFVPITQRMHASPTIQMLVKAVPNAVIGLVNTTLLLFIFLLAAAIGMTSMYHKSLFYRCVNDDYFPLSISVNRSATLSLVLANYTQSLIAPSAFSSVMSLFQQRYDPSSFSPSSFDLRLNNASLRINDFTCGGPYDRALGLQSLACGDGSALCEEVSSITLYGSRCPYGYTCALADKLPFAYLGYDNVLRGFYTTFLIVSFAGWYDVLIALVEASGYAAGFYVVLTLVFGAFFVLKMAIVTITISFRNAQVDIDRRKTEKDKEAKARALASKKTIAGNSFAYGSGGDKWMAGSDAIEMSPIPLLAAATDQSIVLDPGAAGFFPYGAPLLDLRAPAAPEAFCLPAAGKQLQPYKFSLVNRFKSWLNTNVIHTRGFSGFHTCVILLNIIIMCTSRYDSPAEYVELNRVSNIVFNSIYTLEIILRLIGSPYVSAYFRNGMNVLDVAVVSVGWLDITIESVSVPFVRSLRAIRIVKLFKHFPEIYIWIKVLFASMVKSLALLGMLLIFTAVFAIIGMQLFGGKMKPCSHLTSSSCTRGTFDTFWAALLSVLQIITGDDYSELMFAGMAETQSTSTAIFFVAVYYVGNTFLINLIIGVLLVARTSIGNKLQDAIEQAREERTKQFQDGGLQLMREMLLGGEADVNNSKTLPQADSAASGGGGGGGANSGRSNGTRQVSQREVWLFGEDALFEEPIVPVRTEEELQCYSMDYAPTIDGIKDQKALAAMAKQSRTVLNQNLKKRLERNRFLADLDLPGTTLRVLAREIVLSNPFKVFHCLASTGSVLALIMFRPESAPDTAVSVTARTVDLVFACLVVLYTLMMGTAYGFGLHHSSVFLRFRWQMFHMLVLLCTCFSVILRYFSFTGRPWLMHVWTVFTALSALRVFRLLEFSPPMKRTFELLLCAIRSIKNMLIVGFIIFTIWGLMGVDLFSGAFYSCSMPNITTIGSCELAGHQWQKPGLSFDHIGAAFLTLFVMTTLDGWTEVMYHGIDANGPFVAPGYNSHPENALFFVSFVIVSGIFLINLLVSVMIEEFEAQRKNERVRDGGADLSGGYMPPEQRAYVDTVRDLAASVPPIFRIPARPQLIDTVRHQVWQVVATERFDKLMHLFVALNLAPLCLDMYPSDRTTSSTLMYVNIGFVAVYVVECALKIFALQSHFFQSFWNVFDFFLVALSAIGALAELALPLPSVVVNAFRCVRVLRILRPIRSVRSLRKMMRMLAASLFPMCNVVGLVILTFIAFAVVGKLLFGTIKWDGSIITDRSNFNNIMSSLLVLLRLATNGGTREIFGALRVRPPACDLNIGECSSTAAAGLFVAVFVFAAVFILRNLFTAIIVDTCHSIDADKHVQAKWKDAATFITAWRRFDPTWTLTIKTTALCSFLHALPISNGLALNFHIRTMFGTRRDCAELRFLKVLGLKEDADGNLHLRHIIAALCFQMYGAEPSTAVLRVLDKRLASKLHTVPLAWSSEVYSVPAYRRLAVHKIAQYWLRHMHDYRIAAARLAPKTAEALLDKALKLTAAPARRASFSTSPGGRRLPTPQQTPPQSHQRQQKKQPQQQEQDSTGMPLLQLPSSVASPEPRESFSTAQTAARRRWGRPPPQASAPMGDGAEKEDRERLLDLI